MTIFDLVFFCEFINWRYDSAFKSTGLDNLLQWEQRMMEEPVLRDLDRRVGRIDMKAKI